MYLEKIREWAVGREIAWCTLGDKCEVVSSRTTPITDVEARYHDDLGPYILFVGEDFQVGALIANILCVLYRRGKKNAWEYCDFGGPHTVRIDGVPYKQALRQFLEE